MTHYATLMLAAGIGIPVLAALNAALGQHIASPTAAGVVLFAVAFLGSTVVMLLFPGPAALMHLVGAQTLVYRRTSDRLLCPDNHPCCTAFRVGNAVFLCCWVS